MGRANTKFRSLQAHLYLWSQRGSHPWSQYPLVAPPLLRASTLGSERENEEARWQPFVMKDKGIHPIPTITTTAASLQEEPNCFPPLHSHCITSLLRILWNHPIKTQHQRGWCCWFYTSDKIPKNSEFEVNMGLNATHPHPTHTFQTLAAISTLVPLPLGCRWFHRARELPGAPRRYSTHSSHCLQKRNSSKNCGVGRRVPEWEVPPDHHLSLHQQRSNKKGRLHSVTL